MDNACAGHTESEWNDALLRYTENHRGYFPADADGYIALIGDGRADCQESLTLQKPDVA